MTYDEQRAADKTAAATKAAAFRDIAAQIAIELSIVDEHPWILAPRVVHEMGGERSPELVHDDEAIDLTLDGYGKRGRIGVSGSWPRLPDGSYLSARQLDADGYAPITVASDKPPAQIARDIARRFLPGYRALLAKARDRHNQQRNRTALTIATFDHLLAAGGLEADYQSKRDRAQLGDRELSASIRAGEGISGSIRVSGDHVYFERLSVSAAVAARIIAAIRGRSK